MAEMIKVLSYNIHKGLCTLNRRKVLDGIRTALQDLKPDFVFLQEVVGHTEQHRHEVEDWPTNAQFEFLADSVWHHYAYGKNAISDTGHHGNAILSRFPIIDYENIDISTNKLERRGLLHGVAENPATGQRYDLMCIHLDLREYGRQKQLRSICERIDRASDHDAPLLLCGDFNDWRRKATSILMETAGVKEAFNTINGRHIPTFPSFFPTLPLDRIYFRGLTVNQARVLRGQPWRKLSDHLPILADFSVNRPG